MPWISLSKAFKSDDFHDPAMISNMFVETFGPPFKLWSNTSASGPTLPRLISRWIRLHFRRSFSHFKVGKQGFLNVAKVVKIHSLDLQVWLTCTGHGGLKLQGSTFLNELNRLAKELDLEDMTQPETTPCHAVWRGANEGWALPIYPHPPNLRLHVAPQASYLYSLGTPRSLPRPWYSASIEIVTGIYINNIPPL